jgi:hypothetical protein
MSGKVLWTETVPTTRLCFMPGKITTALAQLSAFSSFSQGETHSRSSFILHTFLVMILAHVGVPCSYSLRLQPEGF